MMHTSEVDELIPIGKLISTHGIKGEMKLFPYSGSCESLSHNPNVLLVSPKGVQTDLEIRRVSSGGGKHIIAFRGFDSINQIESFIGCELFLKHSQLPPTADDEYYWCDLMGLQVVTDQGQPLGKVTDIFATASSDIYVVKNDQREYLIPAIADVIASVDLQAGIMTITPLDGLLDL